MYFTTLRQIFGVSARFPLAMALCGAFAVACGDDQIATGNESAADAAAGDTVAVQEIGLPDLVVIATDLNTAPPDLGVAVDVVAAAETASGADVPADVAGSDVPVAAVCKTDQDCGSLVISACSATCKDGACIAPASNDGGACDAGNKCTAGDKCQSGTCIVGAIKCDDGNPCTDDACANAVQGCTNLPNANTCTDGDACSSSP